MRLDGIEVIEVTRATRVGRRHRGKNDTRDAEAAARSVLCGHATAAPKARDGIVESIRVLRNTRASAVKARTQAILHIKNLIVTAPEDLREQLNDLTNRQLVTRCARMHRSSRRDSLAATCTALRSLARRHGHSTARSPNSTRNSPNSPRAPLNEPGIGPEIAARLLLIAGDNPTRLRNDAALAALCGASPIEASSGKTIRHRINRGGDRQGNSKLWLIANNRMIHDPETRDDVKRRTAQGKNTQRDPPLPYAPHRPRHFSLLIADLRDAHSQSALT